MPDPFPMAQPNPAFPGQPAQPPVVVVQSPPPVVQKSGGCFKGCCLVLVVLGVIGVVGIVILWANSKKFIGMMAGAVIDSSTMTSVEKTEARDLVPKWIDAVNAKKISDADAKALVEEFNKAGADGRYDDAELRSLFGRMKKQLRDAGYSLPSSEFTNVADPNARYEVVVTSIPDGGEEAVARILSDAKHVSVNEARSLVRSLPATVASGKSKAEADALVQALQRAGCSVKFNLEKAQ